MQSSSASTETSATVAVLPADVLASVLGLLPPRSLAASRCVCKSWRAVVDERRLLLRHVLPHSVRGLLINYYGYRRPHLFSRPTTVDAVPREVDASEPDRNRIRGWYEVVDQCNGLVLYRKKGLRVTHMYVCNPATRWWVRLPPAPARRGSDVRLRRRRVFLVFDPAVSPHYTVLVPTMERKKDDNDDPCRQMEWLPTPWTWLEFSSRTRRWKEKAFVREADAVEGLLRNSLGCSVVEPRWRYAAYWQGSLYVHDHGEYVSRMSLLNDTYRVIKSPIELAESKNDDNNGRSFLGRSKDGIYFAAINDKGKLLVWTLNESTDQTAVWVSKHQSNIMTRSWWSWCSFDKQNEGPWTLDVSSNKNTNQDASAAEQNVCWNSDDDDIIDVADDEDEGYSFVEFLGFHPYEEVIFLCIMGLDVVAYHLSSSKVQYLGSASPRADNRGVRESFVYTPCLIIGDY